MKTNQNIAFRTGMMTLVVFVLAAVCVPALAKKRTLTILHTNDTHSCVLPQNSNLADTVVAGRGGFLRRIALLAEERKKDPDLLYFDSGDFSQGSAYYTMFKGDVEVGLMNMMHVDASTIGNHEFDFGLDNLARLADMANFPILCSNYDFTGTVLEGKIKTHVVLMRKGLRIGVFALDPEMDGLVSKANCQGVTFLDPVAKAQEYADILRYKEKCDLVVLISHLGWDEGTLSDQYVIANTRGIDLVLGGHSHTYFETLRYARNLDGQEVPVDQNGKHAAFVGKMTLKFDNTRTGR